MSKQIEKKIPYFKRRNRGKNKPFGVSVIVGEKRPAGREEILRDAPVSGKGGICDARGKKHLFLGKSFPQKPPFLGTFLPLRGKIVLRIRGPPRGGNISAKKGHLLSVTKKRAISTGKERKKAGAHQGNLGLA